MASSGWQNEQFIHTVNNWLTYYANIRVDGIEHGASTLRVYGKIALCCRNGSQGGGGHQTVNNGINADINGSGGSFGTSFYQGTDYYVDFDTTFNNVSASATSYSITAYYKSCYNAACSDSSAYWKAWPSWTITFDAYGSDPSNLSTTYNSSTWNSINATASVGDWGSSSGSRLESIAVVGSSDAEIDNITSSNWENYGRISWADTSGNSTVTYDMRPDNISASFDSPLPLLGMRRYYLAVWATNSINKSTGYFDSTIRYLPPAPGNLSYQEPVNDNDYTISYVGVAADNNADYDFTELKRTVRYKIDNGAWVYIINDILTSLTATTTSDITIPPGRSATVEAWMSYMGLQSAVSTVTIVNNSSPIALYGSVNGETVKIDKLYGSVNGETVKIEKLYGSVEGVARKVFEDV